MMILDYDALLTYLSDNQLFLSFTDIVSSDDLIGVVDKYGLYQIGDTVYYYKFESVMK